MTRFGHHWVQNSGQFFSRMNLTQLRRAEQKVPEVLRFRTSSRERGFDRCGRDIQIFDFARLEGGVLVMLDGHEQSKKNRVKLSIVNTPRIHQHEASCAIDRRPSGLTKGWGFTVVENYDKEAKRSVWGHPPGDRWINVIFCLQPYHPQLGLVVVSPGDSEYHLWESHSSGSLYCGVSSNRIRAFYSGVNLSSETVVRRTAPKHIGRVLCRKRPFCIFDFLHSVTSYRGLLEAEL
jgi:hypothetical protein